jgi:predicted cobalt transporter CbtA
VGRLATNVLYVAAMVVVIVGVDLLFFRNHTWARLAANVGLVLLAVAFYYRFLNRS